MTSLVIPGTIDETHLHLPEGLSYKEWYVCGEVLQRMERCVGWWIGDWLAYGEVKYGEMYSQAVQEITGKTYDTLAKYKYVAENVESFRRRQKLNFSQHAEVAKFQPVEQDKWLERAEKENLSVQSLRNEIRREERTKIVTKETSVIYPDKYRVILADPPWRYEYSLSESRAIENQYPTMELAEIKGLDIPAYDDCVLFLWVTSPKLPEALEVIEAWDFTYRTCMIWAKDRIGMGYYARQKHELLLIAKRGNLPVPLPEDRPRSVIEAPRGAHSEKPECFYRIIEKMYPEYNKIELFQRKPRGGWYGWGNQA